jgi:hypothetical protein
MFDYLENLSKTGRLNNRIALQSEDSAAVYITLLKDIGKIMKISRNFTKLIPIVDKSMSPVGQNIKIMMCDEVATVHDSILLDCVQKRDFNQSLGSNRLMIGK